jgi:predicted AAA+ superfamily ATPase
MDFKTLTAPYCPWLDPEARGTWEESVPPFRRPVFHELIEDLRSLRQILSITGPRRVGKSTLLQQIVQHLLDTENVPAERLVYYSLDDPARLRMPSGGEDVLEQLMRHLHQLGQTGPVYLFLDEIHKLERWELYLKKYYDLNYPVKIVISGSASSPIFKKSRESLLGRVKDYHVLPFSFREFLLFRLNARPELRPLVEEINALGAVGSQIKAVLSGAPTHDAIETVVVTELSEVLWDQAQTTLDDYLIDGGFPEVWSLPTQEKKLDYLYDNQIKKVIYEDLVLAAEFRKPEQLKAFYISLLEQPGREVSQKSLAREAGVNIQQVDKYLPLLEMTDLLAHASKFRSSAVRVRRGNMKFYLVDLALRNAVLRIGKGLFSDSRMLGLYAENLVFNALRKWKGVLQIDYYRSSGGREVDFIVHTRPSRYLPVEVKYQETISPQDQVGVDSFATRHKHKIEKPIMITKNKEDFGRRESCFLLPLVHFLLMMD